MKTIQKPDANPMVSALLTLFVFQSGHIFTNGQSKKWIMILVSTFIGSILCCVPGMVIGILSVIDSHQTATRLQAGEEIGENEYSNPTLFKICKIIDKTATCKAAV